MRPCGSNAAPSSGSIREKFFACASVFPHATFSTVSARSLSRGASVTPVASGTRRNGDGAGSKRAICARLARSESAQRGSAPTHGCTPDVSGGAGKDSFVFFFFDLYGVEWRARFANRHAATYICTYFG